MTSRQVLGRSGESAAADWYLARGYSVLDRNWRCRDGEIDLVVGDGRAVVFCEVKTRSSSVYGTPLEAVTPTKQARLRRLAAQWLASGALAPAQRRVIRFDVASVSGGVVDVLEAAF